MEKVKGRPYLPAKPSKDTWQTPSWLFEVLNYEFNFTVDGAADASNTLLSRYWTEDSKVFDISWQGESVYINPPFDQPTLAAFAKKAWRETRSPNTLAVMLVPVKADQQWWHDYAIRTEVRFIRGRISFSGAKATLPQPVALLVFGLNYGSRMVGMER